MSDQWLPPFVIVDDDDKPVGPIEDGDAVRICCPGRRTVWERMLHACT